MINKVEERLSQVLDPGTGLSVMRMGLVRSIQVDESRSVVALTFRPSSNVCPLAFKLAADMVNAVKSIEGVNRVTLHVENYVRAKELEEAFREI